MPSLTVFSVRFWRNGRKKLLPALCYLTAIFLLLLGQRYAARAWERQMYPLRYAAIVSDCAEECRLEEALVYAIICCESNFQPRAVSKAGACGLMQLLPATYAFMAERLALPEDGIFEAESNIRAGCHYYLYLLARFNYPEVALVAYNAGEGTVSHWLADSRYSQDGKSLTEIPYHETKRYLKKVIDTAEMYRRIYFSERK